MRTIKLTKGKVALVSDADFHRLSQHNWCASLESRGKKWYAIRWKTITVTEWVGSARTAITYRRRVKVRMHHIVKGIYASEDLAGLVVDHVNDNSLDNRRSNLKIITQRQNLLKCPGWKRRHHETSDRKTKRKTTRPRLKGAA